LAKAAALGRRVAAGVLVNDDVVAGRRERQQAPGQLGALA